MAQKIVTVCDQHAARGQEVPGVTWRLAVMVPGGRLATYDVDACQDCAKPFVDLAQFLSDVGRPVGKTPRAVPQADDTPEAERTCPECGLVSVNRTAMRTHLRARHGKTVGQTTAATAALECPECGGAYDTPQGLGAHRKRAHGVAGSSAKAQADQAARNGKD
jgi:uncharacterized C2H2 Zn-finger protein